MFRVTANTLHRTTLRDIQRTAEDFARAQQHVSSGRRLQRPSDAPAATAVAMRERAETRALDRYREATDAVDARLRVTDGVLSDIISSITAAQTRVAAGRTTVLTTPQREAIALEIESASQTVFTAINTRYRGAYLFAGAASLTAPYEQSGSVVSAYKGDSTAVEVDLSRSSSAEVTVDGGAMLKGGAARDLFETLDALAAAVRAGDMSALDAGSADLTQAFDRVTAAQSRVGATLNALPAERTRLDDLRRASDGRRAQLEEISLAEAISGMTRAQQAQQAAIAAAGTSPRLSLMDYLR